MSFIIFEKIEQNILKSICKLDASILKKLDNTIEYSYKDKLEFIADMQSQYKRIKETGISSLSAKPSKCIYCYPTGKAYSFHNPDTDDFVIRYVIHQESDKVFRVEECRNIPPRKDGMPF